MPIKMKDGSTGLTLDRLREVIAYDAKTGLLTWAIHKRKCKPGTLAGTVNHGYLVIRVDGKLFQAHRLAWLHMTGEWPALRIDHIDGNGLNNAWANLRQATASQNAQNQKNPRAGSSTGLIGVSKNGSAFRATIWLNGKARHIGNFSTPDLAHEAYVSAKRELHEFGTL